LIESESMSRKRKMQGTEHTVDSQAKGSLTASRLTTHKRGSVLVVGPGLLGRGGISAVIRLHQQTDTWQRRGAVLLSTYEDRGSFRKVWAAISAYSQAPFRLLRAEVLHLHLAAQTSLLRKIPILLMARLLRRPIIVHFHTPSEENLIDKTPAWATRLVFRSASRVIALSESWHAIFVHHYPGTQAVILPNPVRVFGPVAARHDAPPVVLFVGRLEDRKGYRDLLKAAVEILREFPSAEFWFAGQGALETARQYADEQGISQSVRLLGWVDGTDLEEVFRQATLLALPSRAEGMPMSVIEAMSHGLPVVCTPVGGLSELIHEDETGLLVEPGDVPALTEQILRLLRDPEFANSLGRAGQALVQRECSLEAVSAALDTLYTEVIAEGRRPA
jgi:glycosyltransferase involved in cell wall biosynthesis